MINTTERHKKSITKSSSAPVSQAKARPLINFSNLHVGGGVQVAASFLSEISGAANWNPSPSVVLSSEVKDSLSDEVKSSHVISEAVVIDVRGFAPWSRLVRGQLDRSTLVFTLFGPLYRWNPPFKSIVGFAQPWIIYPNNECYGMMTLFQSFKSRIKFWAQAQFFKRADVLVVELEHVKLGLVKELGIDPSRIHVVYNCLSGIYADSNCWEAVTVPPADGSLRLGFVGRNYFHKNTAIFPEIASRLREKHGIEAKFYVTFTEAEWQACSPAFREVCVNVGVLSPAQCPAFYLSLDAVVFPSLLECFSATPLEAMAMGKPLFASDRPFNRDICGEHAVYFDPNSPMDAADEIGRIFENGGPTKAVLDAARDHAITFSTPVARAESYLALMELISSQTQFD